MPWTKPGWAAGWLGLHWKRKKSMSKVDSRIKDAVEELMGNESLLEMLEGSAAGELLSWGIELAKGVVRGTAEMEDEAAAAVMMPRLRAVRQMLRSIGNWVAGEYADPSARIKLRDGLLEEFKTIFGEGRWMPTPAQIDGVLQQASDQALAPRELIKNLRSLFGQIGFGGDNDEAR
jgi:hypothetical protein